MTDAKVKQILDTLQNAIEKDLVGRTVQESDEKQQEFKRQYPALNTAILQILWMET